MKHLSIALINLPLLALGTALAQTPTAVDYDDMLSPLERASNRHPDLYPEWTWMTEGQAALVLKAHGSTSFSISKGLVNSGEERP